MKRIKTTLAHAVYFFVNFFYFGKLSVYHFEFIDLIIENKSLLLLTWEFKRKYVIRIPQLNKTVISRHGSLILSLPINTNRAHIFISSSWRRTKIDIEFKKVSLTKEVGDHFIKEAARIEMPRVVIKRVNDVHGLRPNPLFPKPLLKSKLINTKINKMRLRSNQLIYQPKTTV